VDNLSTQIVQLVACIDHVRNFQQRFTLPFLLLLACDVLEKHRQPVFVRINPNVVPRFEILVPVTRLKRLE
jgi:hypothetical protein